MRAGRQRPYECPRRNELRNYEQEYKRRVDAGGENPHGRWFYGSLGGLLFCMIAFSMVIA